MKKKTIGITVILIAVIAIAGGAGYAWGYNQKNAQGTQEASHKKEIEESSIIGVVNMDEGIEENGERINYADSIIQFQSSTFEYVSLSEARAGLENGTYGAYITIPATFSKSVASINTTPQPAQFEYVINSRLSGKTQYSILYDVLSFGESINNNLSYMYLDNILKEFHQAQDGAAVVIDNDLKDKSAIDEIKAYDLVEMVAIPELKHEENNLEALEIESYVSANTEMVKSVDEEYHKCVEDAKEQLSALKENGETLSEVLASLSADASEIDITKNESGTSIAEEAGVKLEETLEREQNKLQENSADLLAKVLEMQDGVGEIIESLDVSVEKGNIKSEEEVETILGEYEEKIISNIQGLDFKEDPATGGYILEFATKKDGTVKTLGLSVQTDGDGGAEQQDQRALLNAITGRMLAAQYETVNTAVEIPEVDGEAEPNSESDAGQNAEPETTAEIEVSKGIASVLEECNSDAEIAAMLQRTGYADASEFMQSVSNGTADIGTGNKVVVSGDVEQFKKFLIEKVEEVPKEFQLTGYQDYVYDADGNIQSTEDGKELHIADLLEQFKEKLGGADISAGDMLKLDTEGIKSIFDKDYVGTIQKNAEAVKNKFDDRYGKETVAIAGYHEQVAAYRPAVTADFISGNTSEMQKNNTLLQEKVLENNKSYAEFAGNVFKTSEENILAIQKNIEEAKEASNTAVEAGLNDAKLVKDSTSEENQKILADFMKKLPYTRLGSMEYTQAYQFIAKPVILNNSSADNEEEKGSVKVSAEKKAEEKAGASILSYAVYTALGILIIILIVFIYDRIRKARKEVQ